MNILITKADHFKEVIIAEEKVIVGEITAVSDNFIKRLESEFPHFEFQKNVSAPVVDAPPAGESPPSEPPADSTPKKTEPPA